MDETVIAEYARQLMEAHGAAAVAEASQRAARCERDRDRDGAEAWRKVASALRAMLGPRAT